MSSVAKSLYEECLLQACIKKGVATNEQVGKETLEKGLTALNKSTIKARAYMADPNKEAPKKGERKKDELKKDGPQA